MSRPHDYHLDRLFAVSSAKPVGLDEAKRIGQHVYWTGDPCRNGHTTWRYVKSGQCRACTQERATSRKKLGEGRSTLDDVLEDQRLNEELKAIEEI